MTVRCVRNNNPGNLNQDQPWMGLLPRAKMSVEQAAEKRFAVFESPEMGFRAMFVLLHTYATKYGLRTVSRIINRWAPPIENNTAGYKSRVATELGVGLDDVLDMQTRVGDLVKAIATVESGGWDGMWTDQQLRDGRKLAGV